MTTSKLTYLLGAPPPSIITLGIRASKYESVGDRKPWPITTAQQSFCIYHQFLLSPHKSSSV